MFVKHIFLHTFYKPLLGINVGETLEMQLGKAGNNTLKDISVTMPGEGKQN